MIIIQTYLIIHSASSATSHKTTRSLHLAHANPPILRDVVLRCLASAVLHIRYYASIAPMAALKLPTLIPVQISITLSSWGVWDDGSGVVQLWGFRIFRCWESNWIGWNWTVLKLQAFLPGSLHQCRICPNLEASAEAARMESKPFTPGRAMKCEMSVYHPSDSWIHEVFGTLSTQSQNLRLCLTWPGPGSPWWAQCSGPYLHAASQAGCANCGHLCWERQCEAMNHWIARRSMKIPLEFAGWQWKVWNEQHSLFPFVSCSLNTAVLASWLCESSSNMSSKTGDTALETGLGTSLYMTFK